jgi:ferritin
MLSPKVEEALNSQLNAELFSSYLYLSMAAYFEAHSFPGMATWMRFQTQEENMHAMKFYDFILERTGRVELTAIDTPRTEWTSPLNAFEEALQHEQLITGRINDLADLSQQEKDHATHSFLQWFINEQVEEERTAGDIVAKLELVGDDGPALLIVDGELGARQQDEGE